MRGRYARIPERIEEQLSVRSTEIVKSTQLNAKWHWLKYVRYHF